MWKTFIDEDTNYILKINYTKNYEILLTNLESLWITKLSREQICTKCKELNPLIETDDETFLNTTIMLLTDPKCDVQYNLNKNDVSLTLDCKSPLQDIFFKFSITLETADLKTFCQEFALPLIKTIKYLENQQSTLCNVIEKKDAEIKRHVFENGEIGKRELVTEVFNKENLQTPSHLCCEIFSNRDSFNLNDDTIEVKKDLENGPEVKKRKCLTLRQTLLMKKKKKTNYKEKDKKDSDLFF